MGKYSSYATRALKSNDRRYERVFRKMGYLRSDMQAEPVHPLDHDADGRKGGSPKVDASDEMTELREEYLSVIGKRPFHGWDADTLRLKIAAAED